MRKPIVAGNWKCHLTVPQALSLVKSLRDSCETEAVEVVVCPPFTALGPVSEFLRDSSIGLGGQDVFWKPQGAFTGEISAPMLVDLGCRYVIIGHSERRTHFGDTDEIVRRKVHAALDQGLRAIVCVGETLAQREAKETFAILERQLAGGLGECAATHWEHLVVAYEPVWAIGTGRNATPEQAQEAHRFIRQWVAKQLKPEVAGSLRIQYGGSVNATNAGSLLQQPDVDGALVGGASLKAEAFAAIVTAASNTRVAA